MKNPDCTACLWEYACDWSGEDCRYTPEKGGKDEHDGKQAS